MSDDRVNDLVFRALANPTRRALLDQLRDQPHTTGDLCDKIPHLDRTTVMQHLRVLEAADLVIPRREGRERWNHLNPLPIKGIHDRWIGVYAARAVELLERMKGELEVDAAPRPGSAGAGDETAPRHPSGGSPTLYIFSGLPGTGKTTLARSLARAAGAAYLRIDTVEQGLRDLCYVQVQGEGYGIAYRVAADNLRVGTSVVADSCNPISLTRRAWEEIAAESDAHHVNIEVICSDRREHRRRIESRESSISGLPLPTWPEVERRDYDSWPVDRTRVDTAGRSEEESMAELMSSLRRHPQAS